MAWSSMKTRIGRARPWWRTSLRRSFVTPRYGVIYASSGKNLGPAGVTVVIVREDPLERATVHPIPSILDWKKAARSTPIGSLYNTPPVFAIYFMGLVLDGLVARGGLQAVRAHAKARADRLTRSSTRAPATTRMPSIHRPDLSGARGRPGVGATLHGRGGDPRPPPALRTPPLRRTADHPLQRDSRRIRRCARRVPRRLRAHLIAILAD